MAIISPKRFTRSRINQTEKTRQILTFKAGQEWFAFSINAVVQVVSHCDIRTDSTAGANLTTYRNRELLIINLLAQVFDRPRLDQIAHHEKPAPYLMVIKTQTGTLFGILIEQPPCVRRVALTAFTQLSIDYASRINIKCVHSLVKAEDQPVCLLLNPNELL